MLKKKLRNQKGFTLIEIIAVLIILGILAAVAVPKFMNLQDDAKKRAMEGALAEGMSTMSIAYGKLALSNSIAPTVSAVATKASNNAPASTEFQYTFASSGNVKVTGIGPMAGAAAVSKNWVLP